MQTHNMIQGSQNGKTWNIKKLSVCYDFGFYKETSHSH